LLELNSLHGKQNSGYYWSLHERAEFLGVSEEVKLSMRRTGYLGISLLLVFALTALALPAFGQAAQAKQPQAKTQAEYNAYKALYDEQNPAKKAELGEKFLTDFKESDFIANAYTMIIGAYTRAQNWAKVIDAAERAAASPVADNKLKAFAYANAMVAAQNMNQLDRVLAYGDKVLAIDPNDLQTMITLSAAIPVKLPADEAGKKAALDKAEFLGRKALAGVQTLLAQAPAAQKAQITQIEGQLHGTLGLIAYNRPDYMKSIEEYEAALKVNPKDDVAHFYIGADYQTLSGLASRQYQDAVKAENDAKAAKADQPTIDELAAKRQGLENEVREKRDKAIDEYAIAAAIGGVIAQDSKNALQKLWQAKNDSLNGMDEFIAQKKQQLGQ
jgi:tetratricopeptide (TPR) repeat protein